MNQQKLIELCAKAMGLSPAEQAAICYDPPENADQADALLEYVAQNDDWDVQRHVGGTGIITYDCTMDNGVGYSRDCKTQNLAKILCSLRASDKVTDAEINDAMEGE